MTVISAIINKYCTVHATDSLITVLQKDGTREPIEYKQSKIVRVHHLKGAISYWGLASYPNYKWSTLDWLKKQAGIAKKYNSAEEFAEHLAKDLNKEINRMHFKDNLHSGIGLHFTAYENIENFKIPELFLITNYKDPSYRELYEDGIRLYRNTFSTICSMGERKPEHRDVSYRKIVREALQSGRWLYFNNGDPGIYNIISQGIFSIFNVYAQRKYLKDAEETETYRAIASLPIDVIKNSQERFIRKKYKSAGGTTHVLSISPNGEYQSETGD